MPIFIFVIYLCYKKKISFFSKIIFKYDMTNSVMRFHIPCRVKSYVTLNILAMSGIVSVLYRIGK